MCNWIFWPFIDRWPANKNRAKIKPIRKTAPTTTTLDFLCSGVVNVNSNNRRGWNVANCAKDKFGDSEQRTAVSLLRNVLMTTPVHEMPAEMGKVKFFVGGLRTHRKARVLFRWSNTRNWNHRFENTATPKTHRATNCTACMHVYYVCMQAREARGTATTTTAAVTTVCVYVMWIAGANAQEAKRHSLVLHCRQCNTVIYCFGCVCVAGLVLCVFVCVMLDGFWFLVGQWLQKEIPTLAFRVCFGFAWTVFCFEYASYNWSPSIRRCTEMSLFYAWMNFSMPHAVEWIDLSVHHLNCIFGWSAYVPSMICGNFESFRTVSPVPNRN